MNEPFSKKTFGNQHLLPKLPVPGLDETCDKFIEWVRPLLTPSEFVNTGKIVEAFRQPGGNGEKLQKKLIQWSQQPDLPNWLEPFWDEKYLLSRTPLPINVNFSTACDEHPAAKGLSQVQRAAALIHLTLRFKSLLDQEKLAVDKDRKGPLCMVQFKRLFSTTRIPGQDIDRLRSPVLPTDPPSAAEKHIVVLHNGHIFALDVLDDPAKPRSIGAIEAELAHILSLGAEKVAADQAVGVLTTMNRDKWAQARYTLLQIDPQNKASLDTIESALFALCLDDFSPDTLDERFRAILHGNGRDRWFDKSFQFIVGKNGTWGANGEHSWLDGYPVHRLIRFIYDESTRLPKSIKRSGNSSDTRARKLDFHLDDRMRRIISTAAKDFRHAIESTATTVLAFQDFGKEHIKSFRISPDAFVQLALQVATVKCFGRCKSVYESASTRRYQNGRTETLRSVSAESHRFVADMLSPTCDTQTQSDSLRTAAAKHIARMKECMAGKGVERHLFGLLSIYKRFGKKLGIYAEPDIFGDIGWRTLSHNALSTTSNPDPHGVVLSGFGPAVDEGFGICYTTTGSGITITLTSRSACKDAMGQFGEALEKALRNMSALLQSTR